MKMRVITTIFVVLSLFGCSLQPSIQIISTKFGEYSYQLSGEGKPTIILESGMGDDMRTWQSSFARFEENSQVLAYNRAGFPGSSSKNSQRDGHTINLELRELLKELNIPPPYILVGHSLGGLYMKLFANTFPDEVAGVVFIDPTHHEMREICKNPDGEYCVNEIPWWAKILYPDALANEYRQLDRSLELSRNVNNFPEVPVVVVSSGKVPKGLNKTDDEWVESQGWQKYFTTLAPFSKHIICRSCGHHVHQDRPALISEALEWVFKNGNFKN